LLTVGGSSGPGLCHELTGPHRRTQEPGASTHPLAPRSLRPVRSGALAIDRGPAFQVHSLLAQQSEHATPPLRRDMVLAAYRAHLAGRVRYYGPITPVDLRI
jgi:hypothetical protein